MSKLDNELLTPHMTGYGHTQVDDMALGKDIMHVLETVYPGHMWFVNVSHEGGDATIQLLYHGDDGLKRIWKWGMRLHINKLHNGGEFKKRIMRAGGEVLERYGLARRKVTMEEFSELYRKGSSVDTTNSIRG